MAHLVHCMSGTETYTHVHQGEQLFSDTSHEEFPQEYELGDAVAVDLRPHLEELGQLLEELRV